MLEIPLSLVRRRMPTGARPFAPKDNTLARYEMKYLVDVRLLEPIRGFVTTFCGPDRFCRGNPPEYGVKTLQFDSPWGDLYRAKENKALNRFKLRARTYENDRSPLFLEIKRKLGDVVMKTRVVFKPGWDDLESLIMGNQVSPLMRHGDEMAFLEFRRLMQQIGARPSCLIRYQRESYVSENDAYARVTFDRFMRYQPTSYWAMEARCEDWRRMDTGTALRRPFPAFVLELKASDNMPTWMAELVERFNLTRCGFCKYATALRLESLLRGAQYSDASENCTY